MVALDEAIAQLGTSASDVTAARTLDLRARSLHSLDFLERCASELQLLLLSSNMLSQLDDALIACARLRKLDISANAIDGLPPKADMARLAQMQVLYLHDNQLTSLKSIGSLSALPQLVRLTLHGNPLASHPSYRHVVVNSVVSLRALDTYIISDEELIEDTSFSERCARGAQLPRRARPPRPCIAADPVVLARYAPMSAAAHLPLYEGLPPSRDAPAPAEADTVLYISE